MKVEEGKVSGVRKAVASHSQEMLAMSKKEKSGMMREGEEQERNEPC